MNLFVGLYNMDNKHTNSKGNTHREEHRGFSLAKRLSSVPDSFVVELLMV